MLTWRPVFGPFPAWRAWPKMVWSIWSGGTSARRSASIAASSPSSTAGVSANDPRNFPIGVRAPSRMTARSMPTSLAGPLRSPGALKRRQVRVAHLREDPVMAAPPSTGSLGGVAVASA